MAGARQIIDLPVVTDPLPYGLWDAAEKPPAEAHWQQGVTWVERCPEGATTYDACVSVTASGEAPPTPPDKTPNVPQEFRGATPLTVVAEFECSAVSLGDAETVASNALARVEPRQLEAAFWTGTIGGQPLAFPHLAADAEVLDGQQIVLQPVASPVVTGADVVHGLGALEAQLDECYSARGVIHVPRVALPTLAAHKLAREDDDGRLVTPSGNRIVVGSGYPGTGPDGTTPAAGTTWLYATGRVFGMRGDIQMASPRESLDRATNTIRMIAERTYVLGFECCLLAAHIVLGVPTE